MVHKSYFLIVTTIFLFYSNQVSAQSALKVSANQLCACLDENFISNEEVKVDSLKLTHKEIFANCTGKTMANNLEQLSKKYEMGTVEGIVNIRNKLVGLLYKDCDRFRKMFAENRTEKAFLHTT